MEASQLLKQLKDDGWYLGDTEGACRQYVHRQGPGVITVCVRYTDLLGPETLQSARTPAEPSRSEQPRETAGVAVDEEVDDQVDDEQPEVVVEATSTGASAYSPALTGCVATGRDEAEARARMAEAMVLHRKRLRESA